MPSNFTENFQLSQWEAADQVKREDFNADNAKIDAALAAASFGDCRIAMGSYVGTGERGADHPNSLTFDFYPKVIFLDCRSYHSGSSSLDYPILLAGLRRFGDINNACTTTWEGKTVSWYTTSSSSNQSQAAAKQFNTLDKVYYYIVLGSAEE